MIEQVRTTSSARRNGRNVAAHGEAHESIVRLVRGASIELPTRNLAEIDNCTRLLAPGSDVYVPCLPATTLHYILSVATRLRECGMNPVPHLAARGLATTAVAEGILARLREQAGVTRVLLIAGDNKTATGPFDSSLALLRTGLLQACGISSVGVAGYPEGHRRISLQVMNELLERKLEYAGAHGLDLFIASQFCFDGGQVLDWLAQLRARGIALPVRIGLAGPTIVRTLLKYGVRCGIGRSLSRVFGSNPVSMDRMLEWYGPENFVRLIAPSASKLGVAGLHFLPFGGFARSAAWIDEVAAGRFELRKPEQGFALLEAHPAN